MPTTPAPTTDVFAIDATAQDVLFREARTPNNFSDEPVTDAEIDIFDREAVFIERIAQEIELEDAIAVENVGEHANWESGSKVLKFIDDGIQYRVQILGGEMAQRDRRALAVEFADAIIANQPRTPDSTE